MIARGADEGSVPPRGTRSVDGADPSRSEVPQDSDDGWASTGVPVSAAVVTRRRERP